MLKLWGPFVTFSKGVCLVGQIHVSKAQLPLCTMCSTLRPTIFQYNGDTELMTFFCSEYRREGRSKVDVVVSSGLVWIFRQIIRSTSLWYCSSLLNDNVTVTLPYCALLFLSSRACFISPLWMGY